MTRTAFLTATWRYLVMLNYEVSPALLEPLVPGGVTLDLWQGRALVSVVGFRFLDTRVLRVPVPLHTDFDEVNLRFYVRHVTAEGEIRRGVTFVRELVPRRAIAVLARFAYNEPYRAVPMRSNAPVDLTEEPGTIAYEWRTAARWQGVSAMAIGKPAALVGGSEAEFVTEHYWGYTRQRDGGTIEYAVTHPPWRVWATEAPTLTADVACLFGRDFVAPLADLPRSAFVAEGSSVVVHRPRRLPDTARQSGARAPEQAG